MRDDDWIPFTMRGIREAGRRERRRLTWIISAWVLVLALVCAFCAWSAMQLREGSESYQDPCSRLTVLCHNACAPGEAECYARCLEAFALCERERR
jgi:hypothetical protein